MSEMIRLATAGSVDDGKSTLIGRLLYDTKSIFADQLESLERTSAERGDSYTNLALLTDGLRAEREQGITIDVAYRYFSTPKRKFIIADTPGHIQYTRNMVTGASTADLAMILVDARNGVLEQSRRHAFIASLLGIRHMVICVNKMDLVDWDQDRFEQIREDFSGFAAKLNVSDLVFVPMSALHGDNIVTRSADSDWWDGMPLLHHLETVHIGSDRNLIDARLPVQYVIRPQAGTNHQLHDYRGYAGTIASGTFKLGDEVVVLPSGRTSTVTAVTAPGGVPLVEAFGPQAVTVQLADDIDISRGDMICRPNNRPEVSSELDAMVCWFSDETVLAPGARFSLRHTTRAVMARIEAIDYGFDVNTLHRQLGTERLDLNAVGRVRIRTQQPLMFDPYTRNRATGSFILVDPVTNNTVAAGMILGDGSKTSGGIVEHPSKVSRSDRGSAGLTVWFTGLSGAGKSTVAMELESRLVRSGRPAFVLDGDNLRKGLNSDLGFSPSDRRENVRRVGEVAKILAEAGLVAIVSLISPYREDRYAARVLHEGAGIEFREVFVDAPIELCQSRDPKSLYTKASSGELTTLTGMGEPYQPPILPELVLRPAHGGPAAMAELVMATLPPDTNASD